MCPGDGVLRKKLLGVFQITSFCILEKEIE